jgi:hypothetical protein
LCRQRSAHDADSRLSNSKLHIRFAAERPPAGGSRVSASLELLLPTCCMTGGTKAKRSLPGFRSPYSSIKTSTNPIRDSRNHNTRSCAEARGKTRPCEQQPYLFITLTPAERGSRVVLPTAKQSKTVKGAAGTQATITTLDIRSRFIRSCHRRAQSSIIQEVLTADSDHSPCSSQSSLFQPRNCSV